MIIQNKHSINKYKHGNNKIHLSQNQDNNLITLTYDNDFVNTIFCRKNKI